MSNRNEAAQRVAQMINDAEQAMDIAMAKTSRLVTELPSLQSEAGLHASWSQPVIVSVCSALGDMTTARGSIIGAHKSLSAIQRRLGIVMEGPVNPKEDEFPEERRYPALRAGRSETVVPLRA
ncbi:hypothetical protein [Brevundimonas sp.]|uniref:hypothetical protein n=1 Tax=Brevundimonas sp. TaxID=1871086 RepID=UPI003D0F8997